MRYVACLDGFHRQHIYRLAQHIVLQHRCLAWEALLWYALCNIVHHVLYPTKEKYCTAEVTLACASDADKWQMQAVKRGCTCGGADVCHASF